VKSHVLPEGLIHAEQSVLGGLLLRPELLVELADLEVEHFADLRNRVVFQAMRNLEAARIAIDVTTLEAHIGQQGKSGAVDYAYLAELALRVPVAENVRDYARFVRDESLKRRVAVVAGDALERWRAGDSSGRELLDRLLHQLRELDVDEIADDTRMIGDLAREHIQHIEALVQRRFDGKVELTGYTTGVDTLDNEIGGWTPGIVSIVCARPGHGKSTLLLATADACSARGVGAHVFSMEDPRTMYMNRVLARRSRIPINRVATCELVREDLPRFSGAMHDLTKTGRPWLVDDRSGLTSDEIVRSVRRHARDNKTKVVIVDYLQLVRRNPRSLAKSRHEVIGENLHELADAAKNDGHAYVIGSQLNRELERRDDKRPQESDLRESGTIEERAKCIVGLYRGAKYYEQPREDIDLDENGNTMSVHLFRDTVQLLIIKNSQGPAPARVLARWHGETARIE
jgi:replicative DNA helicase